MFKYFSKIILANVSFFVMSSDSGSWFMTIRLQQSKNDTELGMESSPLNFQEKFKASSVIRRKSILRDILLLWNHTCREGILIWMWWVISLSLIWVKHYIAKRSQVVDLDYDGCWLLTQQKKSWKWFKEPKVIQ